MLIIKELFIIPVFETIKYDCYHDFTKATTYSKICMSLDILGFLSLTLSTDRSTLNPLVVVVFYVFNLVLNNYFVISFRKDPRPRLKTSAGMTFADFPFYSLFRTFLISVSSDGMVLMESIGIYCNIFINSGNFVSSMFYWLFYIKLQTKMVLQMLYMVHSCCCVSWFWRLIHLILPI